jgi:hypothetical protein
MNDEIVNNFLNNLDYIIKNLDYILKNPKNKNTLWFIKKIDEINLNAVVKLALNEKNKEFENSIITVFALSDRRVSNKIKKLIRIK